MTQRVERAHPAPVRVEVLLPPGRSTAHIFNPRATLPIMEFHPPRHQIATSAISAMAISILGLSGAAGCKKAARTPPPAKSSSPVEIDTAARLANAQEEVSRTEVTLTKRFMDLDKRRLRLGNATPAEVEAYNRDAALYSADLDALRRRHAAVKQMQDADSARRHAPPDAEQRAQACLTRLRAAINVNDWPSQVAAMEQALAQFRNTQAFGQISAIAQPRLAAMTPAELDKAMRKTAGSAPLTAAGAAPAARSEAEALVQQLRALINQPIQTVPKSGERVGTYNFHGGGSPLDYAQITREELARDRMTFAQPQIEARDHPGVYYRSDDTEFNIRLKWYYADPTKPTKRLTDIEYDRIIDLCRRIAAAQKSTVSASASETVAPSPGAGTSTQVSPLQLWPRIEALKRDWPR
jgi:hypothetical protein